jgi:hypothetical protein
LRRRGRPSPGLYRVGRVLPTPGSSRPWLLALPGEEDFLEASVAEIHAYPPKPEGFEEPLFPTRESRRAVADHLLAAPWLGRASELGRGSGGSARAPREPVRVERCLGRVGISWASGRRGRRKRRRVVEVLARWREVSAWWDEGQAKDRNVFRVLLSCGSVVDLAWEDPGGWFLVGVED